jgi:hypothetical protein
MKTNCREKIGGHRFRSIRSDTIIAENFIKQNAQPNEIDKITSQRIKYSHTNLLTYQAQQLHRNTSISYPCQPLHYHQMNYKNVYKHLLIVSNKKNKLQQKKRVKKTTIK